MNTIVRQTIRYSSIATAALLAATSGLRAQQADALDHFALSLGPQVRNVAAFNEPRVGALGELLMRIPYGAVVLRASAGVSHFGASSDRFRGQICNPDGPCDYYAPSVTVAAIGIGVERPFSKRNSNSLHAPRIIAAISGYQVISASLPGPGGRLVSARRGERAVAGFQTGVIVPVPTLSNRAELELRVEWLNRPIESTRYFIPLVARFNW